VQRLLDEKPQADLRVIVVWEPVIFTDITQPTRFALSLVKDGRAAQFWDHDHALSHAMGGDDDEVVWDYIAIYAAGVRWLEQPPSPRFAGGTVISVIDEAREALEP